MSKVDLIVPKNANSFPNIQTELRHVKEAIEENQGDDEELKETVAKHTTELAEHDDELFEKIPSYVDLGLPSGKLWATMNIGAKNETDYGKYFSWGNIQGYYANEPYNFSGVNDNEDGFVDPYASTKGATLLGDNNIPVNPEFDAARAELGGDWRMPTQEDFQELYDNCTWTWTTKNGVNGYNVASNASGNSNSIFLPAAGYRYGESINNVGSSGNYWSSSFCSGNGPCYSYELYFGSGSLDPNNSDFRYYGFSIRPIHPATSTPAPIKRSKKYIEITYNELKALRDSNKLIPGSLYRITDYITTTMQANTQSAGHQFDIIVRADAVNKLNENAFAALHSGDTYFANSKLEAWELKYCLDNINWSSQIIPTTYKIGNNTWYTAPSKGSSGYYQWNRQNAEPYYTESLENGAAAYFNHGSMVSSGNTLSVVGSDEEGFGTITWMKDENDNECPYDFKNVMFKPGAKEQTGIVEGVFYYTFSVATGTNDAIITDHSLNGMYCYGNKMGKYVTEHKHKLNANVFRNASSTSNCYYNTFGNNCYYNTFGNNCYYNTFGNSCYYNTFGNSFNHNTFGNSFNSNTFGENCYSNTFGNGCNHNTFGNNCDHNTFGNSCYYNTFGENCAYIIFGTSSSTKSFCRYIIVDNGNQYIYLDCSATTTPSAYLQNVKIAQGANNTSTYKTIIHTTTGDIFQTIYQPANSQVISV